MEHAPILAKASPRILEFGQLVQQAAPIRWLWHGYLATGAITLLTSRWKAGKTTLVALLLKEFEQGGEFVGRQVAAGRAVMISEESPDFWVRRGEKLGFGKQIGFLCRPFPSRPTLDEWEALVDGLIAEQVERGLDLVVIDPLAPFLPGTNENNAVTMLAGLTPLQRLTAAGIAVLILHHPRKADEQPRGSGALSGFVDILIEMSGPRPGAGEDRRRRLQAASRFTETTRDLRIELNAGSTEYAVVDKPTAESFVEAWAIAKLILETNVSPLTCRELAKLWPADPPPNRTTLWRWLEHAVAEGKASRSGSGQRGDAFRYGSAESEGIP